MFVSIKYGMYSNRIIEYNNKTRIDNIDVWLKELKMKVIIITNVHKLMITFDIEKFGVIEVVTRL